MKRINCENVELTDDEQFISYQFDGYLDAGLSVPDALAKVKGDPHLAKWTVDLDFWDWLRNGPTHDWAYVRDEQRGWIAHETCLKCGRIRPYEGGTPEIDRR